MRIAMWSGPRNLSTAMMYAFAQRPDCAVWDEPFYAAYLVRSGLDHPMRDEVIAVGESDQERVVARLQAPIPNGKEHFYQKHMTHHMLPGFDLSWAINCRNVFLIRHPARVVASYAAKREDPDFADLGFDRQLEIFEYLFARGCDPIVIDSGDILANPKRALRSLCKALGLPFDTAMLNWSTGPKTFDGVWAAHWYNAVHATTGFSGSEAELPRLTGTYADLVSQALPIYREMRSSRLGARPSRRA